MNTRSAGQLRMQVRTDVIHGQDLAALKSQCECLGARLAGVLNVSFEEGEDEGNYLNIVFGSHSPEDLWPQIKAALYRSAAHGPTLQAQSIAVRTGRDGWNDYVLLHHFDPGVPVEQWL
jgi:hypothetical protein